MSSGSETPSENAESKVEKRRGSGEDNDEDPLVIDEENEKSSGTTGDKTNANVEDDGTGNTDEDNEKEFEPTVDMLMNEFDDEATIEEEEALAQDDEGRHYINYIVNFLHELD